MKFETELDKKKAVIEGKEIEYYILKIKSITGEMVEVPIKKDKATLLILSKELEKFRNK